MDSRKFDSRVIDAMDLHQQVNITGKHVSAGPCRGSFSTKTDLFMAAFGGGSGGGGFDVSVGLLAMSLLVLVLVLLLVVKPGRGTSPVAYMPNASCCSSSTIEWGVRMNGAWQKRISKEEKHIRAHPQKRKTTVCVCVCGGGWGGLCKVYKDESRIPPGWYPYACCPPPSVGIDAVRFGRGGGAKEPNSTSS